LRLDTENACRDGERFKRWLMPSSDADCGVKVFSEHGGR
jgi:hypothetical protein